MDDLLYVSSSFIGLFPAGRTGKFGINRGIDRIEPE
jgi:hypothetical protein